MKQRVKNMNEILRHMILIICTIQVLTPKPYTPPPITAGASTKTATLAEAIGISSFLALLLLI